MVGETSPSGQFESGMSTAEPGTGEFGMVPSGVENVGGAPPVPPVPPVEPVTSLLVVASPMLVPPPTDVVLVEPLPVVTEPPPDPVVTPALVELVEVTDTMPTVIVALPVDEAPGPVVAPPVVAVESVPAFAVLSSLFSGEALESPPPQLARPSRSRE